MSMAFPVPDHLPRQRVVPGDVASKVLSKISSATSKSLTAGLASEWLKDLDEGIRETESRIYGCAHDSLRDFERHLESAQSVQLRSNEFTSNVKELSESLSNPETGLLPRLITVLNDQSGLAQSAHDADVEYEALLHLSKCCQEFDELAVNLRNGNLVDGSDRCASLRGLLDDAPEALSMADVMLDMRRQLRAFSDQLEEQLGDACKRCVCITSTEFRIAPTVQVRKAQATVSLEDVLSRLSDISLESFLNSLRRDIVAYFIEFPAQTPVSTEVIQGQDEDGTPSVCLSIFPLPDNSRHRSTALTHFRIFFDFLSSDLFPALPYSRRASFRQSLYKPTASTILKNILDPALPSNLSGLPDFLQVAHTATVFEQEYLEEKDSKNARHELQFGSIETWVRGIASRYGRKRRTSLLEKARTLASSGVKSGAAEEPNIRVEISHKLKEYGIERLSNDAAAKHTSYHDEDSPESAWDFDDINPDNVGGPIVSVNISEPVRGGESETKTKVEENNEEDAWCFDDDLGDSGETVLDDSSRVHDEIEDAWGWGGDDDLGDSGADGEQSAKVSQNTSKTVVSDSMGEEHTWNAHNDEPDPFPSQPVKPAKVAKRLEKLSSKGKEKNSSLINHPFSEMASTSIPPSPALSGYSTAPSSNAHSPRTDSLYSSPRSHYASPEQPHLDSSKHDSPVSSQNLQPTKLETYSVTKRAESVLRLLSDILREGWEILHSKVLSESGLLATSSADNSSTPPSILVFQAAPMALELYRAVYPVTHSRELSRPERALLFSNDCLYLSEEIAKLNFTDCAMTSIQEQMHESQRRFRYLSTWWFDEGIERQREITLQILARANGFFDMGDQDRFDECESLMSDVLRAIRVSANQWKAILSRSMYFSAVGQVVQAALTRVVADVLALSDIPELESRRLSELCRILNALEGLFVDPDDPTASSMVLNYVPAWLKYSYLSELLEASIADIAYLFDEGALIDFQVNELEHLVRALFADTPLRANTISKLQHGHPAALS